MALLCSWQSKSVTNATYCVDERWFVDIYLLAKVGDIGFNDSSISTEIVIPYMIENLRLTDYAIGVDE